MTTTPNSDVLDRATIDLIFALRDSLTDDGPSRIDFWSGGRAISALEAASAGASCASEAITIAARKLQIPQINKHHAKAVKKIAAIIDEDYPAWASHVNRNAVYILALADIERIEQRAKAVEEKKPAKEKIAAPTTDQLPF